jgi:transcription elongation factor Elf1
MKRKSADNQAKQTKVYLTDIAERLPVDTWFTRDQFSEAIGIKSCSTRQRLKTLVDDDILIMRHRSHIFEYLLSLSTKNALILNSALREKGSQKIGAPDMSKSIKDLTCLSCNVKLTAENSTSNNRSTRAQVCNDCHADMKKENARDKRKAKIHQFKDRVAAKRREREEEFLDLEDMELDNYDEEYPDEVFTPTSKPSPELQERRRKADYEKELREIESEFEL